MPDKSFYLIGFPLCIAVFRCQVLLLCAYSASNCSQVFEAAHICAATYQYYVVTVTGMHKLIVQAQKQKMFVSFIIFTCTIAL